MIKKKPKAAPEKPTVIPQPATLPQQIDEGFHPRVKHMANIGDIVASLAAVKSLWLQTKATAVYCQCVDVPAAYYQGAVHPTTSQDGTMVTVNEKMFQMIKPLVEAQPYIHRFEKYTGQAIEVNFDVIRGKTNVNMPHGMLAAWPMYAFPDLAYDLSTPWVHIPEEKIALEDKLKGKILLNFTERYRNQVIDYFFLRRFATDLVFAGTEREHQLFCSKWQLYNVPRLEVNNFLELAHAIRACRFVLANQSFCWNLANAMGTPRILEACMYADNCHGFIGPDNYSFYYQEAAEYYFRLLDGEKK